MSVMTLEETDPARNAEAMGCPVVGHPLGLRERTANSPCLRTICAIITFALHVLAIPAFFFATTQVHLTKAAHTVMTVSLLPATAAKSVAMPPSHVAMVQPVAQTVAAPVVPVQTGANAISVPRTETAALATSADPEALKNAWAARLIARLVAVKRYPREAVAAHEEGVVSLHFVIDRAGRVLNADIAQSSGFDALDKEALALAYRAQPLPKPPSSLAGDTFDLVVPVRFALNG